MSKKINEIDKSVEDHELELELNKYGKISDNKYLEYFYKELFNTICILEKSKYLIKKTESNNILNYYNNLFSLNMENSKFMGRNPRSLEIQHVIDNLPNNYTVTDKADGLRYFLSIFDNRVYLISTNLNITYTGIELSKKLSKYNNTILDGEYIYLKKHDRYIFMVFDCLYKSNQPIIEEDSFFQRLKYSEEVIDNCFIFSKQKGNKFKYYKSNYDENKINKFYKNELTDYFNNLNNDISIEKDKLLVRRKFFMPILGAHDSEIFKVSTLLYDSCTLDKNIDMPYQIDGLIYHPINQKYSFTQRD